MSFVWGVSYFGNRYPHHARADLQAMADAGATYVVHVMTEEDLRWNPRTIAELVEISRQVGLEAWLDPWGVGGVFGGEAASYAVMERPASCQRTNSGKHAPALCPADVEFKALMERWLDAAAASGAAVCLWDEPHLFILRHQRGPTKWSCRCRRCQRAFKRRFGGAMPSEWTPEVRLFLEDLIAETIAWLAEAADRRGLESAIVLLPDEEYYDAPLWRATAALPGVRAIGTDPYWLMHPRDPTANRAYVRRWSERTVAATRGLPAKPMSWVQAFRVPRGREDELTWAVDLMVESGIESVAAWSYLGAAAMSGLACDDPAAVWTTLLRAFARHAPLGQLAATTLPATG